MTAITEGWMHNKPFLTLQPAEVFRHCSSADPLSAATIEGG